MAQPWKSLLPSLFGKPDSIETTKPLPKYDKDLPLTQLQDHRVRRTPVYMHTNNINLRLFLVISTLFKKNSNVHTHRHAAYRICTC